jgi:predicted transcriptional regulator
MKTVAVRLADPIDEKLTVLAKEKRKKKAVLIRDVVGDYVKRSTIKSPSPRRGWAEKFRAMAEDGDDRLLDPATATRFDAEEWEW